MRNSAAILGASTNYTLAVQRQPPGAVRWWSYPFHWAAYRIYVLKKDASVK